MGLQWTSLAARNPDARLRVVVVVNMDKPFNSRSLVQTRELLVRVRNFCDRNVQLRSDHPAAESIVAKPTLAKRLSTLWLGPDVHNDIPQAPKFMILLTHTPAGTEDDRIEELKSYLYDGTIRPCHPIRLANACSVW